MRRTPSTIASAPPSLLAASESSAPVVPQRRSPRGSVKPSWSGGGVVVTGSSGERGPTARGQDRHCDGRRARHRPRPRAGAGPARRHRPRGLRRRRRHRAGRRAGRADRRGVRPAGHRGEQRRHRPRQGHLEHGAGGLRRRHARPRARHLADDAPGRQALAGPPPGGGALHRTGHQHDLRGRSGRRLRPVELRRGQGRDRRTDADRQPGGGQGAAGRAAGRGMGRDLLAEGVRRPGRHPRPGGGLRRGVRTLRRLGRPAAGRTEDGRADADAPRHRRAVRRAPAAAAESCTPRSPPNAP